MSGPRRLLRNLVSLSTGELATRLIGFTAFAVLARRLEPSDYGAVEFAVALALFFTMVVDFGLGTIGARAISQDRSEVDQLAAQIPAARLLIVIFAIPAMGGIAMAAGQPPETVNLVWLFSLGLLAVPWFQRWLLQGLEMMNMVSIGQVVRSAVFCLGVVIFIKGPEDLLSVGRVEIFAALVGSVFYLGVQHFRIAPIRVNFAPKAIRGLLRESSSVGLSQMVWASNQYVPTILVAALIGGEAMSWFGASQRIVLAIVSFSWVYHFNLFPSLSRYVVESLPSFDALVRTSFRSVAWLAIMVSLATVLFAEAICQLVFGQDFGPAALPLKILAWIIPVTMLSGHARITLIAGEMQQFVLIAQLSGLIINLLIGFATIPTYGATAGAATMLASNIAVWAVAHFFAVRKVAPLPFFGVVRPLAVAGIIFAVHQIYAPSSYIAAIAALSGYFVFGPLLDKNFVADLRRLINMKRETA